MTINEQNFQGVDLNLMVTFLVVYRERSVTHAALQLRVGQPAVSNALARLRSHFGDPLFLRVGRGICPTLKATKIASTLAPALICIEAVITSDRRSGGKT